MKKQEIPTFIRSVIPWYSAHGRDLPWRQTQDPYAIWLSEIILQQTRVQQGISYYHAFLEKFPKLEDLAKAKEDEIFRVWQGLGYYSRARNLHKAAKILFFDHNGIFPNNFEDWTRIPGVGPYTAAAVSSFAFDFPKAAVDGNVLRWVSRYLGSFSPIDLPKTRNEIQSILDEWILHSSAHIFNQASMEFGAIICSPKKPACHMCPLQSSCISYQNNWMQEIPVKSKKTKVKEQGVFSLFIENKKGEWAVSKRIDDGIWRGLYTLPLLITDHINEQAGWQELAYKLELPASKIQVTEIWKATHLLTHRKLQVHIFSILLDDIEINTHKFEKWIDSTEAERIGFPKIFVDFLRHKALV
jgi:A/G-specific adenine glycosylase